MNIIEKKTFQSERSLYNLKNTHVRACIFEGIEDGESSLKEARNIIVSKCIFSLRYPMWHNKHFTLSSSEFHLSSRAPLWYSSYGDISKVRIESVKALRECRHINIKDSNMMSEEFGWRCRDISVKDSYLESFYLFFESRHLDISNISMLGKYSFQYVSDAIISNSRLDTKDAFWHSNNVTVKNSVIKGEYLGWFSKGLTLINCKIIGTQPLCYCKNLKLINCEMIDADLAFEYSDVDADIVGSIKSIKNPRSGIIRVNEVDEIINTDSIMKSTCRIIIK